ncbi:hypothetical protein LXL04_020767 [Taraxacum kok-saghyz]
MTRFGDEFANGFPRYPLVSSVNTMAEDRRNGRNLIDVVGRVVWGKQRDPLHAFEIFLQDETGNIIKLMLNNVPNNWMGTVLAAITNKSIMFVSRLKMVHRGLNNMLVSTILADFAVEPIMPEADTIREMFVGEN